jgi:hypothetical protein
MRNDTNVAITERVGVFDVSREDVHRVVSQAHQHRYERTPAKIPKRTTEQIGIDLFLRVGVDPFLERNVYEVEEIEEADPCDSGHEMEPAQNNSSQRSGVRRMEHVLKHSQTDGEMSS